MFSLRHVNSAIWYVGQSRHIHYKQLVQLLTPLAKIQAQVMEQGEAEDVLLLSKHCHYNI